MIKYSLTCFLVVIALYSSGQNSNSKNNKNNMKQTSKTDTMHHHHNHGAANEHMNKTSFENLTAAFEDTERIKTQKPDEVIALLGNIQGKTIMDIGAGTGEITKELSQAGFSSYTVNETLMPYQYVIIAN